MEQFMNNIFRYMRDRKIENITQTYHMDDDKKHFFNTLIIELLSWLKLEYKRVLWQKEKKYVKNKPLQLNMNHSWCQILSELVEKDVVFSKYFRIINGEFDFDENVSAQEKEMARKMAHENYNPKLMR